MKSNSDIKIYVVNSDSYKSLLNELNYDVKESLKDANYLLIKDDDKEFNVNAYRSEMKYAFDNDITILLSSKGIPCFVDQFTIGTYFTQLFLNDSKYVNDHWKVYPPEGYNNAPKYFDIFPKGKEPKYFNVEHDDGFIYKNEPDRCCYSCWNGLFY